MILSLKNLEKRAAQCIQRSVIRQWFGFLAVKNFIDRIPHMAWDSRVVSSQIVILTSYGCIDVTA